MSIGRIIRVGFLSVLATIAPKTFAEGPVVPPVTPVPPAMTDMLVTTASCVWGSADGSGKIPVVAYTEIRLPAMNPPFTAAGAENTPMVAGITLPSSCQGQTTTGQIPVTVAAGLKQVIFGQQFVAPPGQQAPDLWRAFLQVGHGMAQQPQQATQKPNPADDVSQATAWAAAHAATLDKARDDMRRYQANYAPIADHAVDEFKYGRR